MIGPLELATISIATGVTATIAGFAFLQGMWVREFEDRIIWGEDTTARVKLRVHYRHSYETTDWGKTAVYLPLFAVVVAIATAVLVLLAIGALEVFGR